MKYPLKNIYYRNYILKNDNPLDLRSKNLIESIYYKKYSPNKAKHHNLHTK